MTDSKKIIDKAVNGAELQAKGNQKYYSGVTNLLLGVFTVGHTTVQAVFAAAPMTRTYMLMNTAVMGVGGMFTVGGVMQMRDGMKAIADGEFLINQARRELDTMTYELSKPKTEPVVAEKNEPAPKKEDVVAYPNLSNETTSTSVNDPLTAPVAAAEVKKQNSFSFKQQNNGTLFAVEKKDTVEVKPEGEVKSEVGVKSEVDVKPEVEVKSEVENQSSARNTM